LRPDGVVVDVNEEVLNTDELDDMTGGNPYGH
jgi:hypothetical protein